MNESGGRPSGTERSAGRRRSDRIVGASRAIQDVIERAMAAGASELPVSITGPEGSGKEHAARAIHHWSARATGPFEIVSCVGVPEALRGRELFGCSDSVYPSLPQAYAGGLERAVGGTLIVDHADALSSELLQAFVKAVTEGRFQREGDAELLPVRARVILMARGPFTREPFDGVPHHDVTVPPLSERSEDILPLAAHFLAHAAEEEGIPAVGFTSDARAALCAETWPGNVRELAQRVGHALRLSGSGAISAEALMLSGQPDEVPSFKDAKRAFERRYVCGLLRRCGGNISRAARLAKKDRKDFYDVIRRTGVDPAEFR